MTVSKVSVVLPHQFQGFRAEVSTRIGPDFSKWTDVSQFLSLIVSGRVYNFNGWLRLFGSRDYFKGIQVSAFLSEATSKYGRVIVSAGSDPKYDCWAERNELACGQFDRTELPLCVLSLIDFSRIPVADIHISVVSPIGPGASVGTSAATEVAILRAFLGKGYPADEIARLAVYAEKQIFGGNTGNQDQLASAYGSAMRPACCLDIEIHDLYDFDISLPRVGQNIRELINCCSVLVYLGYHNSSSIHQGLMDKLLSAPPDETKDKLLRMKESSDLAAAAICGDNIGMFGNACETMLTAQIGLGEELVNFNASQLINLATSAGGFVGAAVPGAGGNGGSLLLYFASRDTLVSFVRSISSLGLDFPFTLFEMRLADDGVEP